MAAMRGWEVSKLDVKGAFLNAPIPQDELILVEPPKQWKDWGIVGKHVVWKLRRAVYGLLRRAVYGLRRSPNFAATLLSMRTTNFLGKTSRVFNR